MLGFFKINNGMMLMVLDAEAGIGGIIGLF